MYSKHLNSSSINDSQVVINPKMLFISNGEQLSCKYLFHFQHRLLILRTTLLNTCFHLIPTWDVTQILFLLIYSFIFENFILASVPRFHTPRHQQLPHKTAIVFFHPFCWQ